MVKVNEKPNKELNSNPDFLMFASAGKFVANKHDKIGDNSGLILDGNKLQQYQFNFWPVTF